MAPERVIGTLKDFKYSDSGVGLLTSVARFIQINLFLLFARQSLAYTLDATVCLPNGMTLLDHFCQFEDNRIINVTTALSTETFQLHRQPRLAHTSGPDVQLEAEGHTSVVRFPPDDSPGLADLDPSVFNAALMLFIWRWQGGDVHMSGADADVLFNLDRWAHTCTYFNIALIFEADFTENEWISARFGRDDFSCLRGQLNPEDPDELDFECFGRIRGFARITFPGTCHHRPIIHILAMIVVQVSISFPGYIVVLFPPALSDSCYFKFS